MSRPLTITAYGNAQVDTGEKKSGSGSLQLDQNQDYLKVEQPNGELNIASGQPWTIECWFYYDSAYGSNTDVMLLAAMGGTNSGSEWHLSLNIDNGPGPNLVRFFTNGTPGTGNLDVVAATYNNTINAWHHVAVTSNGTNTLKLWWDGELKDTQSSEPYVGLTAENSGTNKDLWIGGWEKPSGAAEQWMGGWIDEVRISNNQRYTANFTPQSRFVPDDNTLLLVHMDGTDGSTTFTDDIGIQGSSAVAAQATLSGTANPNPSMVFIRDDYPLTWDDTDTWDSLGGIQDSWWPGYRFPTEQFALSGSLTSAVFGSSDLSSEFALVAQPSKTLNAQSNLETEANLSVSALKLVRASSDLQIESQSSASIDRTLGGRSDLSAFVSQITVAENLDIASADLTANFDLSASGGITQQISSALSITAEVIASANKLVNIDAVLAANFDQTTRAGLIITIDDPYEYTWDTIDPDEWTGFVKDEWGPEGWFAFDAVSLTASISRSVNVQSDLSGDFAVTANSTIVKDISSDLSSECLVLVSGEISRDITVNLTSEFALTASAVNLDLGSYNEFGEFSLEARAGITLNAEANIEEAFNFELTAQRLKRAQANLESSTELLCEPSLIPNIILDPVLAEFTATARAGITLNARTNLSAFATELAVGERLPGGSAQITATTELSVKGGIIIPVDADLEAFVATISDGRFSNIRGSANLQSQFTTVFEGDLRLLESDFIFPIPYETRLYELHSESRTLMLLPEQRSHKVKSESRFFDILPETRTLEVE